MYLRRGPFSGFALLIFNGLTNLTAAAPPIKNRKPGVILGGIFGVTLIMWICIQFYMFELNFMSPAPRRGGSPGRRASGKTLQMAARGCLKTNAYTAKSHAGAADGRPRATLECMIMRFEAAPICRVRPMINPQDGQGRFADEARRREATAHA